MTDYAKMDAELDDQLRAIYAPNNEASDEASDSPELSGTESDVTEDKTEKPEEVNQTESSVDSVDSVGDAENETEPVVPESRYKEAVRAMNKAQQEAAAYRKEESQRDELIRQLQSQVQELQQALADRQASKQSTDTPSSTPDTVDDDELKEAQEYYPEVVKPLLKMIDQLKKEIDGMKGEFGSVKSVTDHYRQESQKSAEQQHIDTILAAHPDASDIANSTEYAEWFEKQSPMVRHALTEGSAADVISALDLFKAKHAEFRAGPVNEKPKADKLEAAKQAAVPTVRNTARPGANKPSFTRQQIANMPREEFMKHEAEIDAALAKGQIL